MVKTKLILAAFLFFHLSVNSQTSSEKIVYIVDSITVVDDPEDGNEILPIDIAEIVVIKNQDSLRLLGYGDFTGAIFLFTKEYRTRPDSLRKIPSSKKMVLKNGTWFLKNNIYTGPFVDYYYSGRKLGEGYLTNGKLDGRRLLYYQDGHIIMERTYKNGVTNGVEKEYYPDGTLSQQGEFIEGKEEGIWESYYPNSQVKLRSNYKGGEVYDTAVKYYSNGKIKEKVFIKGGVVKPDPGLKKIEELMLKSNNSDKEGDIKSAINYCSKALALDSTYAEGYFSRATLKLNDFAFDDAIKDFDKALELEPFMEVALTNRAFARIRKYQFAGSRILSQNKDVTVSAAKDKVTLPEDEKQKICNDLQKAIFLGEKSKMITQALADYCK